MPAVSLRRRLFRCCCCQLILPRYYADISPPYFAYDAALEITLTLLPGYYHGCHFHAAMLPCRRHAMLP